MRNRLLKSIFKYIRSLNSGSSTETVSGGKLLSYQAIKIIGYIKESKIAERVITRLLRLSIIRWCIFKNYIVPKIYPIYSPLNHIHDAIYIPYNLTIFETQ